MTVITDIQNALDAKIEATLPGYVRLSDSYDAPDNPNLYLKKGYATAYGPGENDSDNFCVGDIRIKRQFVVVLTNTYNASLDADKRQLLEQNLMEDHLKIALAVESDPSLGDVCIDSGYETDGGLEYIVDEKFNKQFIGIVSNFQIRYIERNS
jgi:hypothetical protein